MRKLITAWCKLIAHLGKILSGIGAVLLSLDVAGLANQLKAYADMYLGQKGAQKVGLALFVLLFARTAWAGVQFARLKQQAAPPPGPPPTCP